MPQAYLGTKDEGALDLTKSRDLIAVRTRSRRPLRSGPVRRPAVQQLDDGELVLAFPEAGVEVYRVKPDVPHASLDQRKSALRRDPDVQFAGGVLIDRAGEPVLYTENLFVKFVDSADPDDSKQVLRDLGLEIRQELEFATNAFFCSAPEGVGERVFEIAQALIQREDVEYCHPELVRRRQQRAIFAQQWHLQPTSIGGRAINAHANVKAAHDVTRGEGVTIAIIDDGIDIDHPEFSRAGKVVAPRDATFALSHAQGQNPRPKDDGYPDNHGTACAGVACASGVDGASGVAPAAKLMPIRLAAGLGSQQEANAFKWAADHGADVISCSWGPVDGDWWDPSDPTHTTKVKLPASTKLAIDYVVSQGRGGKGCVVLFAAGNGNEQVEMDGYASYEKVIAVAACNDRGLRSVYSDYGKAVWCSFPSSDIGWPEQDRPEPLTPGIYTTDRMSRLGYNPGGGAGEGDAKGNYTNSFGGTSSACPGAAGVVALALAANPALTASEVRDIVRRGCDRIDPQGGEYDATFHSAFYGYGRMNALSIVQLACPTLRDSLVVARNYNLPLPDLQTVEATLDVGESTRVDQLSVQLELLHTYIGDLVITLRPPPSSGLPDVVLHQRAGGAGKNLKRVYDATSTPALSSYRDKVLAGRWTLRVSDQAQLDSGTLVRFGLELKLVAQPIAARPGDGESRAA
jgi:subtilisin-like proprotein convertase family protein